MKLKTSAILFAFLIIAIVILADGGRLDALGFIYRFRGGDKAGHFILFGILSFLLNLTFLRSLHTSDPKRVTLITTLLLALAIGFEEWAQQFFPLRTSDWVDLVFSYAGIVLGAWIAYKNSPLQKSGEGNRG